MQRYMNASEATLETLKGALLWAEYMNASGQRDCAKRHAAYAAWEAKHNAERPEIIRKAQAVQSDTFDWALVRD